MGVCTHRNHAIYCMSYSDGESWKPIGKWKKPLFQKAEIVLIQSLKSLKKNTIHLELIWSSQKQEREYMGI